VNTTGLQHPRHNYIDIIEQGSGTYIICLAAVLYGWTSESSPANESMEYPSPLWAINSRAVRVIQCMTSIYNRLVVEMQDACS